MESSIHKPDQTLPYPKFAYIGHGNIRHKIGDAKPDRSPVCATFFASFLKGRKRQVYLKVNPKKV